MTVINLNSTNFKIAVYTGNADIQQLESIEILADNFDEENLIFVSSIDEGKAKLNRGDVPLFVVIDSTQTPEKIIAYYDGSAKTSKNLMYNFDAQKGTYSYQMVKAYLSDFGFEIDEDYFNIIEFDTDIHLSMQQIPFTIEIMVAVSLMLVLGMAYSVSKDNETNVSKNLKYLPINTHKYILSKFVPYIIIGLIEMTVLLILGIVILKIFPALNILLVLLLSLLGIIAIIALAFVFSNLKNQISAILCNLITILAPIFVLTSSFFKGLPIIIQIFLYFLPVTPFYALLNGMMYHKIILWENVAILITQIVVYYLIGWFILKKKLQN